MADLKIVITTEMFLMNISYTKEGRYLINLQKAKPLLFDLHLIR